MSIIIIVIILLVLVFLWYMWFLQKKNAGVLNSYKDNITNLKEDRFKDKIIKIEDMNLTGSSSERFVSVKKEYYQQLNEVVPDISTEMRKAEYKNTQFKVFGASKLLKEIDGEMSNVETKFGKLEADLDNLSNSDEQNSLRRDELHKGYQLLRKQVLTQSFDYGSAADNLEDELSEVATLLDEEETSTKDGDHLEASQFLDDARVKIALITDQLKVIEPLHRELNEIFPGQVEEINDVYQKLLNQQFKFNDNIADLINDVQEKMIKSDNALGELNFDETSNLNDKIKANIENLYDILTLEVEAKRSVLKQQKPVLDYINHANYQHNKLERRMQELEEHYILKSSDKTSIEDNRKELIDLRESYDQDVQDIADKKVIYSQAEVTFKDIIEKLDRIEEEEKSVNESLNQMISSEKIAVNSVDQYAKRLEIQKKIVEQLRLNGLPDYYLDYFYMVYDEINKLYDELNSKQVNMEDISKQVIVAQEDLENLVQKTTELKQQVKLAEKLIQYANRYGNHDDEFKDQLERSRSIFDNEYDYNKAVEIISKELERVEPGSVERIKETINA
ncbi:septation ring formation regulator EzrA [Companilactobacillus baiquanensis]|uniref:Septation ring formation regulator EzrA n=1 Tax=Companilactobacillus baiquanensis TaxID=2486005 RepID=A0ABW1UUU1_9LACO|nr:septation ring formation regulator EzrA [Companilactobacillus baiquanensis]